MKKALTLTILALALTLSACGQPTAEPMATVAVETPDATIPPTIAPARQAEAALTPVPTPRDQAVGESTAFTYALPESQGVSPEAASPSSMSTRSMGPKATALSKRAVTSA